MATRSVKVSYNRTKGAGFLLPIHFSNNTAHRDRAPPQKAKFWGRSENFSCRNPMPTVNARARRRARTYQRTRLRSLKPIPPGSESLSAADAKPKAAPHTNKIPHKSVSKIALPMLQGVNSDSVSAFHQFYPYNTA